MNSKKNTFGTRNMLKTLKSIHHELPMPVEIKFVNKLDKKAEFFWIDYEGNEKLYADLEPNKSYVQKTYVDHPWVIKENGNPVALFLPSKTGDAIID